jgi:hypothetical protein
LSAWLEATRDPTAKRKCDESPLNASPRGHGCGRGAARASIRTVTYTVFSQAPEGRAVTDLVVAASARFDVTVVDLGVPLGASPGEHALRVSSRGVAGRFRLSVRPTTAGDLDRARTAETAGRSAGMAALAQRCRAVWTVSPEGDAPEWLVLELCAVLAFAALGPILPPDESALLGVRSAQGRAEALRRGD